MDGNEAQSPEGTELRITTALGELAGLQWGDAGSPPLLALHGWLDNAASFSRLAPLLAGRRRVIALDLPGHGHSAHLPDRASRYHLVDYVDHVLRFADALGLERFVLLGHSLGGGVASLVAAAVPDRIERLLLIEGIGPAADDGAQTLTRWRRARARSDAGLGRPRVFASIEAAVVARIAADGLESDEVRPIVRRNLREVEGGYVWGSDARLRLETPLRIDEPQVQRLLAGIQAPTLLLLATPAAPYLQDAFVAARVACVADIRVERIAGPHHLHIREPQAVATHLLNALSAS